MPAGCYLPALHMPAGACGVTASRHMIYVWARRDAPCRLAGLSSWPLPAGHANEGASRLARAHPKSPPNPHPLIPRSSSSGGACLRRAGALQQRGRQVQRAAHHGAARGLWRAHHRDQVRHHTALPAAGRPWSAERWQHSRRTQRATTCGDRDGAQGRAPAPAGLPSMWPAPSQIPRAVRWGQPQGDANWQTDSCAQVKQKSTCACGVHRQAEAATAARGRHCEVGGALTSSCDSAAGTRASDSSTSTASIVVNGSFAVFCRVQGVSEPSLTPSSAWCTLAPGHGTGCPLVIKHAARSYLLRCSHVVHELHRHTRSGM